jgi:hypothetical protein
MRQDNLPRKETGVQTDEDRRKPGWQGPGIRTRAGTEGKAAKEGRRCIRARRQAAMSKAEAALEQGRHQHDTVTAKIEADRAALDRQANAEEARWNKKLKRLEEDLRKASR